MAAEINIICRLAQDRYRNAALWRNLWTILLFAVGAVVAVFLVLAVVFFLRQDWLPAAAAALGTIVDGAGMKWVVDRRKDAVEEEREAYQEVREACRDVSRADQLGSKLRLWGPIR
jgi:hypothetical protein